MSAYTYSDDLLQGALEYLQHRNPSFAIYRDILATTLAEQRAEIARQTARAAINERFAQYLEFVLMDMRQTMGQDRIDAVNAERDKTIKALDALEA